MTWQGDITPLAFKTLSSHFCDNVFVFYLNTVHWKFIFYINPPQKAGFLFYESVSDDHLSCRRSLTLRNEGNFKFYRQHNSVALFRLLNCFPFIFTLSVPDAV